MAEINPSTESAYLCSENQSSARMAKGQHSPYNDFSFLGHKMVCGLRYCRKLTTSRRIEIIIEECRWLLPLRCCCDRFCVCGTSAAHYVQWNYEPLIQLWTRLPFNQLGRQENSEKSLGRRHCSHRHVSHISGRFARQPLFNTFRRKHTEHSVVLGSHTTTTVQRTEARTRAHASKKCNNMRGMRLIHRPRRPATAMSEQLSLCSLLLLVRYICASETKYENCQC